MIDEAIVINFQIISLIFPWWLIHLPTRNEQKNLYSIEISQMNQQQQGKRRDQSIDSCSDRRVNSILVNMTSGVRQEKVMYMNKWMMFM